MRQRVARGQRSFAKTLRVKSTEAEQKLWHLLRSRRLMRAKFRRQVPIGAWIVDFVSFRLHLIIEADGSQHVENARDKSRDEDLARRGFRVLRFWNNDILARTGAVAERIAEAIENSPSPGFAPDGAQPPSPTRGEGKKASVNG
ncbi:MAG TPA: endonuclease domain-containing protein [Pseudolabrys sp.]|nr:endonuclease domain-containing protein [Pseudolabrys sp.]